MNEERNELSQSALLDCPKCGKKPSVHTVSFTGEYYKCRGCNFPRACYPIPNNANASQWNNRVKSFKSNKEKTRKF